MSSHARIFRVTSVFHASCSIHTCSLASGLSPAVPNNGSQPVTSASQAPPQCVSSRPSRVWRPTWRRRASCTGACDRVGAGAADARIHHLRRAVPRSGRPGRVHGPSSLAVAVAIVLDQGSRRDRPAASQVCNALSCHRPLVRASDRGLRDYHHALACARLAVFSGVGMGAVDFLVAPLWLVAKLSYRRGCT